VPAQLGTGIAVGDPTTPVPLASIVLAAWVARAIKGIAPVVFTTAPLTCRLFVTKVCPKTTKGTNNNINSNFFSCFFTRLLQQHLPK
jgi:hypothetical protein